MPVSTETLRHSNDCSSARRLYDNDRPSNSIESTPEEVQSQFKTSKSSGQGPKSPEEDLVGIQKLNTGYNPLFTQRWILILFGLLWMSIIVALQILYRVSVSRSGLAPTNDSLRYIWTYGPTGFLVTITVFWRQVDYAVKYIQPWSELAKGPQSASMTLLLDYITPWQIVVLWKSLRNKHFAVWAATLIFVLTKIITVISTGLFVPEEVQFEKIPQEMRVINEFNANGGLDINTLDASVAMTTFGIKSYNMSLPIGTTEKYAFQLFEPSDSSVHNSYAYTASVDVFTPEWECETGALSYTIGTYMPQSNVIWAFISWWTYLEPIYYNVSMKLPNCDIHYNRLEFPDWASRRELTSLSRYWGIYKNVKCSNLDASDPASQRILISFAYSQDGKDNGIILNSSGVVCRPSYSLQTGNVSLFTNGSLDGEIVTAGPKRHIDGVSSSDIAKAVAQTMSLLIPFGSFISLNKTGGFLEILILQNAGSDPTRTLDSSWLSRESGEIFRRYSVQLIRHYFLKNTKTPSYISGFASRTEQRLTVKELPTRMMQGCAAVMTLLTTLLVFFIPQNIVPRSINSIAGITTILARSPSLTQLLEHTGHLDLLSLKHVLESYEFMSILQNNPNSRKFSICAINKTQKPAIYIGKASIKWFRPVTIRRPVIVFTLISTATILATTETLYRISKTHNGIGSINFDSIQKYVCLYMPIIILALLATTFNSLDFELQFTNPYYGLSQGYTTAAKTLLWNPIDHITPKTCVTALRNGRYVLSISSVAVLLAPLLTVLASALLFANIIPYTETRQLKVQTWINIRDLGINESAGPIPKTSLFTPDLILHYNMSYPQWTHSELAFSSLDLSLGNVDKQNLTGAIYDVQIPAARGFVCNCTLIQSDNKGYQSPSYINDSWPPIIIFNYYDPDRCGRFLAENPYDTNITNTKELYIDLPTSGSGYFGRVDGRYANNTNMTKFCQQYHIFYGQVQERIIEHWQLWNCYAGIEYVQANITVRADLSTVVSEPSVLDNTNQGIDVQWGGSPDIVQFSTINRNKSDEAFDGFFDTMIYGQDGVPREELLNGETLLKQFNHTYKQWTAQWLSANARQSVEDISRNTTNQAGIVPSSVTGTFHGFSDHRLFVSIVSTRILEVVLAILFMSGVSILFLLDTSKVLPKPVGSIGAVASLLAGSWLVDERSGLIPPGSEWLSDQEIKQRKLWNNLQFRMGWWSRDEASDTTSLLHQSCSGVDVDGDIDGDFRIDVICEHPS